MYIPKSHRHGFKAASTLVQDDLHPNTSNHGLSGAITSSEIYSDQNDVMKSAVNQRSRVRSREAELPKQLGSLADGDFRMQTKILKSIFKEDDRLGADVPSKGSTVGEPNRYTGCPAPCDCEMNPQKESKYAMMWLAPLPLTATSDSKLSRKSVLTKCSIETYENLIAELNVVPMNLVREIVSYKNELDNLSQDEYQRRRNRLFSSKYVKTYQYGNRAGSKLEDVFRYSDLQGAITNAWLLYSRHSDKFVFADICGGPGAFSQMIFAWVQDKLLLPLKQVHGYGITLRDSESCKWYTTLTSMSQFSPFYGANGQGNIYCKQTRAEFVAHCGCLLPLIVADGGFELQGSQESLQEMLTAHLILCECLLAIQLLSPGGCFILKCFDTLCPFIVSILSDLRRMFQKVGICKPETSRVTNAERYIVCVGFLTSASDASVKDSILSMWGSYADELYTSSFSDKRRENEDANAQKNTSVIPVTIIPLEEFQSEAYEEFLGSVRRVTYYIMSQQAKALRRILDSDTHE